jgi:hypothetical protein
VGYSFETENFAAAIVTSVLGAACFIRRDFGKRGGQASHDFDLRYREGRADEPLEITTAAKTGAIATRVKLGGGAEVTVPGLGLVWDVIPRTSFAAGVDERTGKTKTLPYPLAQVQRHVANALLVLEAAGVREFPSLNIPTDEAIRAAVVLTHGCKLVCGLARPPFRDEQPGVIYRNSHGGVGDPERLAKALLAEACEPGNVAKLSGSAKRRHLFVNVDPSSGDAYVAVRDGALPAELPGLPPEISTLWIGAADRHVFSITPPGGWEKHRIPDEVIEDPAALECGEGVV